MIITITIVLILLLIPIIGKIWMDIKFSKQVKELFVQSKSISNKTFQKNQLEGLPEPVQRYFNLVLKANHPYISYVRMTHEGQFKTGLDKGWIPIKGEQYATTDKPGFIWKGTTTWFTARDLYIGDKGRLVVSLLSLFNVVNAQGGTYDQGELLRWLGESVLYPTNLLPSERLKWVAIDVHKAKLTYHYLNISLFFNISFNEKGEITEMETKRYMDEKKLETWVIKVSNYKEWNNVWIPTFFEVLWKLEKGDFSYAKFKMTKVEYGKAEKFKRTFFNIMVS